MPFSVPSCSPPAHEALSDAAQAFFDFATSTAASDLIANAGAVPVAQ